ncbi:MAG: ClbS/DfsB family four-helix bundle protein, partial [Chloroflexi bacterium]
MDTIAAKAEGRTPLQVDLAEMLQAMRVAERELFALVPDQDRDGAARIGSWSVKDVRAHMAAWRAIEARRLEVDDSNAILHARYADWSWEDVDHEADASVDALLAAIERSSAEMLCECDGTFAGIGANGVNHAMGHLPEVAALGGARGQERFGAFAYEIEAILRRGHLMPRDSGVILYNIACARAVSGEL